VLLDRWRSLPVGQRCLLWYPASLWWYPTLPLSLRYPSSWQRYPTSPLSLHAWRGLVAVFYFAVAVSCLALVIAVSFLAVAVSCLALISSRPAWSRCGILLLHCGGILPRPCRCGILPRCGGILPRPYLFTPGVVLLRYPTLLRRYPALPLSLSVFRGVW